MTLEIGKPAPEFKLPDENGVIHQLADYRGRPLIVYFYPKDDTPGCTVEACNFRDNYSEYRKAGVPVLGISPDKPQRHGKFKQKYDLPFTLLADQDHRVCDRYGAWGKKKYLGREYDGVLRTTFIIDPEGKIAKIYEKVKPDGHSREILKALVEMKLIHPAIE